MTVLQGTGACGGIAVGRVRLIRTESASAERRTVDDPHAEWERFLSARDRAHAELDALYEQALRDIGESGASIFEIHGMMLEDEDYRRAIEKTVLAERANAEYAVMTASEQFAALFSSMEDPYMRARAADVRDIARRLCRILSGGEERPQTAGGGASVLCAEDLSPSETMQLDRETVAAFVTAEGSVNSHTAILARSLGIPAVVGVGKALSAVQNGMRIGVDGFSGKIFLSPDEPTVAALLARREELLRRRALLEKYRGLDNETQDGRRIDVFANLQSIAELGAAKMNDAGGVGLFRSEFLYLDRDAPPDEEEQMRVYRTVLQSMGQRKVVIRTLDAGADKRVPYFDLPCEENPALGLRGARLCLCRPELLVTQLRALYRASVFGKLSVMFPMIVSVAEVDELLTLAARVRRELTDEGYAIDPHVELGIMIETPAAALIAHRLAPLVDFFSVGTNDLSQYTLAIDRQNPAVLRFFDAHHEAILRLVEMAAEAAHASGKWIGVCGELAADTALTARFLALGIDELSVAPSEILPLREHVRGLDLGQKNGR